MRPYASTVLSLLIATIAAAWSFAQQSAPKEKEPIENLRTLTPQIISGGEPHDDASFSKLAELGVRTVVSVDGAKPDVGAARKHGLRYIHIPIGYDGVGGEAQAALTRVVREIKGPIFIHCHHGKHRGPAAAAIACMASGKMTPAEGTAVLKAAGTGKEYAGLWRDVAAFEPLPADAKLPELVETADLETLAAAMAQLDRAWDGVKLCQAAGWKTPAEHADLSPEHQAVLVWEAFRESRRHAEGGEEQLTAWLDEALANAQQLRGAVKAGRGEHATIAYKRLEQACTRCHAEYRN